MAESIPRAFIDDLLARVDIVEVIEQRVPLKKRGNEFTACCPFHKEKTPSFYVSPHKQIFKCFGCGKGGDAITFLCEHDHMNFIEALTSLASQAGISLPETISTDKPISNANALYQLNEKVAKYYYQQLCHNTTAIEYIKNRGLSGEIAKNYQIGFAPDGWDGLIKQFGTDNHTLDLLQQCGLTIQKDNKKSYDRFRNRIMFPIHNRQGRVIGFGGRVLDTTEPKYLNSPETPIFHKGNELYGLYFALKNHKLDNIIIVEGYMDVLALAQHGITHVVATLGTATTKQHLQRIYRYTHNLIFCFDGDNAGRAAAWRACQTLLPLLQDDRQARFMFLPDKEDPDSFVRHQGAPAFLDQLQHATPLSDFLFEHARQQIDLSNIDGRSQYIAQVMPLIDQLPESTFRQLMIEKLAQITRTNVTTLDQAKTHSTHLRVTSTIQHSQQKKRLTPIRAAIALLLQNPQLIEQLNTKIDLSLLHLPGIDVLNELTQLIQQNPKTTTAMLLRHWQPGKMSDLMHELADWPLLIHQKEDLIQEFEGTLQQLKSQQHEHAIEKLLNKAIISPLSEQEKQLLQALIKQSKIE
jgi:DNA primase